MPLDGYKTTSVKLGAEPVHSYNLTAIKNIGKFVMSAPGSGTLSQGGTTYDALEETTGDDLVIRANQNINSASAMVVTITGTDGDGGALTGVATIAAQDREGQSYNVVPSVTGKKFKTITAVTVTNGIAGDGFDIAVLPSDANDVEVKFIQGATFDLGTEVKAIYYRYDHDHNKRIRGERKVTIPAFYVNNKYGLPRINNRDVTWRMDIKDDGGNTITEVWYFQKVRVSTKRVVPAAHDAEITADGEGIFGKEFIFS